MPLRSCVHDRYAKRIDRFFGTNPNLAIQYINHPYFEVRAVAAKYLDLFHVFPPFFKWFTRYLRIPAPATGFIRKGEIPASPVDLSSFLS